MNNLCLFRLFIWQSFKKRVATIQNRKQSTFLFSYLHIVTWEKKGFSIATWNYCFISCKFSRDNVELLRHSRIAFTLKTIMLLYDNYHVTSRWISRYGVEHHGMDHIISHNFHVTMLTLCYFVMIFMLQRETIIIS